jgi:hypothetical protein
VTRNKFVAQYLTPSTASTIATRRVTEQERKAIGSDRVDYHVDQATTKD